MALQISGLRPDDQAIACKCFGPPPQVVVKKYTGGEPQHYQKSRRELQTVANGKNIWDMFDYTVWANVVAAALPAGQAVNFKEPTSLKPLSRWWRQTVQTSLPQR